MNAQDESAVSDVSEQTEPVSQAGETTNYADELLKLAADDGHTIGDAPPKDEAEPETLESEVPATESETETEETETAPEKPEEKAEDDKTEEEDKPPEQKKGDEWPESAKARVAEEAAKRRRANERADKAEAVAAQLQAQLAQVAGPRPTEDNPFLDVQDVTVLDRLERSFEKTIDLADENPDGVVDYVVGRDSQGREIRKDFTPEELVALRKKADKAIRKFIPERRDYLQQRAVADAQALEAYPELKDPDSEFTKVASVLAHGVLTGQSMKAPDALIWIARAVKGYQLEQQRNGKDTSQVKTPEAKRIVESARQKVAPTPTRTRQFVERGTSSASVDKAAKRFEERGDAESAEDYVGAVLSRKGGVNRVEPIAQ